MKKTVQGLYAITDQHLISPKRFSTRVCQALEGGAAIVQYRDKSQQHSLRWEQAKILVELCREYNAVSIINDDVELAKIVNADGVHIGLQDDDIAYARTELGNDKIIGVSCYADILSAQTAIQSSADYVAFGSVFPSSTKPQAPVAGLEILREAKQVLPVPIVAIGGIDLNNMTQVLDAGADAVAIISSVFAAKNVQSAAQQFSDFFKT